MKLLKLFRLMTVAVALVAGQAQAANMAAVNDVVKMQNAGLAEDTIIAYVRGRNLDYDLSAEDVIMLRGQGIPISVLNVMLTSGRALPPTVGIPAPKPVPPAPQPVPVPAQPQPVPVPAQPTVAVPPPPATGNVIVPAVPTSPALNPDVAYFYQELSPHGRWILAEDHQWYWQPTVVLATPGWRPYWDRGHWVYTDQGWYWASDYSWGWAAFHYGRWRLHPHHGWIWLPDRVWSSSWVVWRSGGDYCGWAPLPPGAHYDHSFGGFIYLGRRVEVGFDFGLDWHHFNFTYVRELGEPVMRTRFVKEAEVRGIYPKTTIINNYNVTRVVENNQTVTHVMNRGIAPERVASVKGRSMEAVKLEEMRTPAPKNSHEWMNPDTKTMQVYRPRFGRDRDR